MAFLVAFLIISCKKPPGPGGKAKIIGRVFAHDWETLYDIRLERDIQPTKGFIFFTEKRSNRQ